MQLLTKLRILQLPLEILHLINQFLYQKIKRQYFENTVDFLERDLFFWLHDLNIDRNWIMNAAIYDYIPWPHPNREMYIPVFYDPRDPLFATTEPGLFRSRLSFQSTSTSSTEYEDDTTTNESNSDSE